MQHTTEECGVEGDIVHVTLVNKNCSWLVEWEMVVKEGRVIPADRRGSCCFLLGIVTVTFHGASHAGITNKSSLSVLKKHPVSGGGRGGGF